MEMPEEMDWVWLLLTVYMRPPAENESLHLDVMVVWHTDINFQIYRIIC